MKESLTLTYLPWRNPWPWESIWWGRSWWWRSPWVEGWRCRGSVCASRTRQSCRWYVHLGEALGPTPRPPWRTRSPSAAAKNDWKIKSSQLSHHESPSTKKHQSSVLLAICEGIPPVTCVFPLGWASNMLCITGHLWEESTSLWWISLTKGH